MERGEVRRSFLVQILLRDFEYTPTTIPLGHAEYHSPQLLGVIYHPTNPRERYTIPPGSGLTPNPSSLSGILNHTHATDGSLECSNCSWKAPEWICKLIAVVSVSGVRISYFQNKLVFPPALWEFGKQMICSVIYRGVSSRKRGLGMKLQERKTTCP